MLAYLSHPKSKLHTNGEDHPESSARYGRVEDGLISAGLLDYVLSYEPRRAEDTDILRVHTREMLSHLKKISPLEGLVTLDDDTALSPDTLEAAYYASGAVLDAVDLVLGGQANKAFCNIRPPGHHAEVDRAMGFCIFNHVAVGSAYALDRYGLDRVAILDIDVHHGNGTESYVRQEERAFLVSNFQTGIYPFNPDASDLPNMLNISLPAHTTGEEWLAAWQPAWKKLQEFQPELIFVSAGFDGHQMDEMAHWKLHENDYAEWTRQLLEQAKMLCNGRIISVLEGGYNLLSLDLSVRAHIKTLSEL